MSFVPTTLRMSAGVIVWALHFAAIYGLTALACARGAPSLVPWVIGAATAGAGLACVAIMAFALGRRAQFESWIAVGVAALALVAIVWEAFPMLVMTPCR